jgi:hypothetical protein
VYEGIARASSRARLRYREIVRRGRISLKLGVSPETIAAILRWIRVAWLRGQVCHNLEQRSRNQVVGYPLRSPSACRARWARLTGGARLTRRLPAGADVP